MCLPVIGQRNIRRMSCARLAALSQGPVSKELGRPSLLGQSTPRPWKEWSEKVSLLFQFPVDAVCREWSANVGPALHRRILRLHASRLFGWSGTMHNLAIQDAVRSPLRTHWAQAGSQIAPPSGRTVGEPFKSAVEVFPTKSPIGTSSSPFAAQ